MPSLKDRSNSTDRDLYNNNRVLTEEETKMGDNMDHQVEQTEAVVIEAPSQENQGDRIVSITEAARINNVTRQAIYVAIKQKKLKARKEATRWLIRIEDLEEYRSSKYSRLKSTFEGELLFDNEKGFYSVNQAAKILGVPAQKIYYATRIGLMKATRKGAAWVIHVDEIKEYEAKYLSKKPENMSSTGSIVA
jgi:excisionase family DNA binding protein